MDRARVAWRWAGVSLGLVAAAGLARLAGEAFGHRGFAFAWTVHFALMVWALALAEVARPALLGPWYRVRAWEPRLYRRLGIFTSSARG